jgi:hypothetical protein
MHIVLLTPEDRRTLERIGQIGREAQHVQNVFVTLRIYVTSIVIRAGQGGFRRFLLGFSCKNIFAFGRCLLTTHC